jgi:hypothetical protein
MKLQLTGHFRFSQFHFVSASFAPSLSFKKSRAIAPTCPSYCAKTRGLGTVETADCVFGLQYRGNPVGTVIAV